jgi:hypothetical protein
MELDSLQQAVAVLRVSPPNFVLSKNLKLKDVNVNVIVIAFI